MSDYFSGTCPTCHQEWQPPKSFSSNPSPAAQGSLPEDAERYSGASSGAAGAGTPCHDSGGGLPRPGEEPRWHRTDGGRMPKAGSTVAVYNEDKGEFCRGLWSGHSWKLDESATFGWHITHWWDGPISVPERGGGVAGDPEPLIAAGMKLVEALAFYSPERVRLGRPVKQWREALAAFKGIPFEDTGLNTYEPTPPHSRFTCQWCKGEHDGTHACPALAMQPHTQGGGK